MLIFLRNQEFYMNKLTHSGFGYQATKIIKQKKLTSFIGDICIYVASRDTGNIKSIQKNADKMDIEVVNTG